MTLPVHRARTLSLGVNLMLTAWRQCKSAQLEGLDGEPGTSAGREAAAPTERCLSEFGRSVIFVGHMNVD